MESLYFVVFENYFDYPLLLNHLWKNISVSKSTYLE